MAPNTRRNAPAGTPVARSIQISKSLAWLLRHGAAKERVAITPAGYVNLGDVLAWHKLKALGVTFEEVLDVVVDNEKQRFGLLWDGSENAAEEAGTDAASGSAVKSTELNAEASASTPHALALAHIAATETPEPRSYSIRAVQGHSIKTIDAGSLLTPITAENLPETCVHGTFFAAWLDILASRGLKAMTRNHVHFASGPTLAELGLQGVEKTGAEEEESTKAMERSSVISGMRSDAEVLIYINVKKSMAAGMQWWKSENGVLLTEGVVEKEKAPSELEETSLMMGATGVDGSGPVDGHENGTKTAPSNGNMTKKGHARRVSRTPKSPSKPAVPQKLVPMEYWDMVVGIGVGVLWARGKGVVRDVPAELLKGRRMRMNSIGQGRGGKGRGKGNEKPKVRVERDALGVEPDAVGVDEFE